MVNLVNSRRLFDVRLICMFVFLRSLYLLIIRQSYTRLSILRRVWSYRTSRPSSYITCAAVRQSLHNASHTPHPFRIVWASSQMLPKLAQRSRHYQHPAQTLYKHRTIFMLNIHIKPKTFQIIVQSPTKKLNSERPITY